jgi:PAS domain S-box-containing protein
LATRDVERGFSDSDHTAEEIERLRSLLEASSALLGTLSVEKVLPEVLDLARRTLAADGYALWQLDPETKAWQIAIHSGLSEEYVEHAPGTISGREGTEVSFDAPIVAEEIADAEWLTPEHRRAHAAAGTQSMLAVALRHDERVFGTLAFYYGAPHHFTEAEKSAAWTLGNLAAVAIRTAELYEIQRRRADDRKFVADASEQLASSLDYETTLGNVASLAVGGFSDWCAIDMLDENGSIERLTVAHIDPAKVSWANELLAKYPPDPDVPYGVASVIRTGLPELFTDIPEELLVDAADDQPELLGILRELGLKSTICVPLIARDKAFGAITFVSAERGRRYDEADLATAQDLARSAATAVDNALLFREAEEARRQAQESLAVVDSVFAAAPIGLAFMDTNFCFVRVNDALAEINGVAAEDHHGRTLREVVGDLADEIEPYHRRVTESGEPVLDLHVTGQTAASPGGIRNWLVSYYPVRDANDVTIGVGVVLTDVTEREQARAGAEAATDRLAVLADASQRLASTLDYETTLANLATLLVPRYADWYAVDVLDDQGGFKRLAVAHMDPAKDEWVAKARDHYSADPEEPEGTGRAVRTGEGVLYRTVSDDFLAASTKDPEHHQVLHQLGMESAMVVPLTAGGRTYGALMLVSADPERLYDEDDLDFAQHLARRAAVAVDNARLYRTAEEQARASLVVAHVADGVLLVDRLGVIRLWNPAAEQITGLTMRDALGRRAEDLFGSKEPIAPLPQGETTRPTTYQVDMNGRELWLSITGVGFDDGTVYAFRDLTAERAIEKLKSDFVSTISHELRTPLAAIYGAALTLRRDDVRLGEPQRDGLLEVIANESDRLARIVNDILWASRLESGGMHTTIEQCDGVAIARGVLDAARQYVPPSIELAFSAPDEAPPIAADADKARQVLTNLVDNAVKYSPDGGRVELEVAIAGPRLRFTVHDQGLGIPPAEHRRIFEKFYRLDPDLTRGVGGTGLGLYISRELLERMDGRIWVESSGRGGSTFVAELPIAY